MTRPLPIQQREKIVAAYEQGLGTAQEIVKIFAVTPRSVFRYVQQQRETGDLSPEPIPGRPAILNDENLAIIKEIVLANTDEILEQYRTRFYKETGIDVTIVTIHNACNILNLRRKKTFLPLNKREDVKIKREDYLAAMEDIDPNDIIVIDESGANLSMTSDYARAEGGERAKAPKPPKPHLPGNKFSIIGAIGLASIVATMYISSSVDKETFEAFVIQCLIPKLEAGKYVVMDNVAFHKNSFIVSLIESTGARVVFLPPYSPDLSPIEKMWSKIKEILKRSKPRSNAEFHVALGAALNAVNEDDLHGWYEECGYNIAA